MLKQINVSKEAVIQVAPYNSVRVGVQVVVEVAEGESVQEVSEQAAAIVQARLAGEVEPILNEMYNSEAAMWRARLGIPQPDDSDSEGDDIGF